MTNYTKADATHLLQCRSFNGSVGIDYSMDCLPLKTTKRGMAKVVVFGFRSFVSEDVRIRYVKPDRLIEKSK